MSDLIRVQKFHTTVERAFHEGGPVYVHASYVRSRYDAFPVVVPDAPRPREIVFALAMTTGARIHARLGGLAKTEIAGFDGQR